MFRSRFVILSAAKDDELNQGRLGHEEARRDTKKRPSDSGYFFVTSRASSWPKRFGRIGGSEFVCLRVHSWLTRLGCWGIGRCQTGEFRLRHGPMMEPPPDCLRCGACCFSPAARFVRVTGADWARLGDAAERVAHFAGRGNEAFMKMADGHCVALEVRPGTAADPAPTYFCTVYDRRPQICRDLARGSPECAGERALRSAQDSRRLTTDD